MLVLFYFAMRYKQQDSVLDPRFSTASSPLRIRARAYFDVAGLTVSEGYTSDSLLGK